MHRQLRSPLARLILTLFGTLAVIGSLARADPPRPCLELFPKRQTLLLVESSEVSSLTAATESRLLLIACDKSILIVKSTGDILDEMPMARCVSAAMNTNGSLALLRFRSGKMVLWDREKDATFGLPRPGGYGRGEFLRFEEIGGFFDSEQSLCARVSSLATGDALLVLSAVDRRVVRRLPLSGGDGTLVRVVSGKSAVVIANRDADVDIWEAVERRPPRRLRRSLSTRECGDGVVAYSCDSLRDVAIDPEGDRITLVFVRSTEQSSQVRVESWCRGAATDTWMNAAQVEIDSDDCEVESPFFATCELSNDGEWLAVCEHDGRTIDLFSTRSGKAVARCVVRRENCRETKDAWEHAHGIQFPRICFSALERSLFVASAGPLVVLSQFDLSVLAKRLEPAVAE